MVKAEKQRWGLIYKLTAPNGKYYFGKTICTFRKRMIGHKSNASNPNYASYNGYLQRAIRKHGWENFTKEILIKDVPEEDLDNLEISYIKIHNATNRKYGYNLTEGGEGCTGYVPSEASRRKNSESQKKLQANRKQFGSVTYLKRQRKWRAVSAKPNSKPIGTYFTEEKARTALQLYKNTGEKLQSDYFQRKKGTGTINKIPSGRFKAALTKNKKRYSKVFDTVEECEEWLKSI